MSKNALRLNPMLDDNALARYRVTDDPTATALFAGERAETADLNALARAKELEQRGANREQIWKETGWWKGDKDQRWRFEIDDTNAMLSPRANAVFAPNAPSGAKYGTSQPASGEQFHPGVSLGEFLTHDKFKSAYPGAYSDANDESGSTLRMHYWKNHKDPFGTAFTTPSSLQVPANEWEPDTFSDHQYIELSAPNRSLARSIGLHELQHYIQNLEGFAAGTDPNTAGREGYLNNPGEVEARTVSQRATMTPQQRASTPPWMSMPQKHPRYEK